jgi:hypothetical protein
MRERIIPATVGELAGADVGVIVTPEGSSGSSRSSSS